MTYNILTNGTLADADKVMENFEHVGIVPIGTVLSWLKSYTNTPALDSHFVECNGQILSDVDSVYHGQTIPALNGSSDSDKRFLRGSTTSGTTGGAATYSHNHTYDTQAGADPGDPSIISIDAADTSAIPPYYEVVFIMRIK